MSRISRLKWLGALPETAGLEPQDKVMLVMYFARKGYTVKQITDLDQIVLAHEVEFALQCEAAVAAMAAREIIKLLTALTALVDSPPSVIELKQFITRRQLPLQPRSVLMSIYDAMTSDDPTLISATVDPITGQPFNPVWTQLAIEQLYRLPATGL